MVKHIHVVKTIRPTSGNSSKMVRSVALAISQLRRLPFSAPVRLLKISMRNYPFIVVMTTKSVKLGAMVTILATFPDDVLFLLLLLNHMRGGSFLYFFMFASRLLPHAAQTDLLYIQRRHSLTLSIPHYARHSWVYPPHRVLPQGKALHSLSLYHHHCRYSL